jgi:hypothetical protein
MPSGKPITGSIPPTARPACWLGGTWAWGGGLGLKAHQPRDHLAITRDLAPPGPETAAATGREQRARSGWRAGRGGPTQQPAAPRKNKIPIKISVRPSVASLAGATTQPGCGRPTQPQCAPRARQRACTAMAACSRAGAHAVQGVCSARALKARQRGEATAAPLKYPFPRARARHGSDNTAVHPVAHRARGDIRSSHSSALATFRHCGQCNPGLPLLRSSTILDAEPELIQRCSPPPAVPCDVSLKTEFSAWDCFVLGHRRPSEARVSSTGTRWWAVARQRESLTLVGRQVAPGTGQQGAGAAHRSLLLGRCDPASSCARVRGSACEPGSLVAEQTACKRSTALQPFSPFKLPSESVGTGRPLVASSIVAARRPVSLQAPDTQTPGDQRGSRHYTHSKHSKVTPLAGGNAAWPPRNPRTPPLVVSPAAGAQLMEAAARGA